MYRKAVFDQLRVDILLQSDKSITSNDSCSELYASKPSLPSPPSLQDVASALSETSLPSVAEAVTKQHILLQDTTDSITNTTNSTTSGSSVAGASGKPQEATPSKHSHTLSRPEDIPNSPLLSHKGRSPMRSPTNTGSLRRRNKSAPRNSYEDYDERAISTLR